VSFDAGDKDVQADNSLFIEDITMLNLEAAATAFAYSSPRSGTSSKIITCGSACLCGELQDNENVTSNAWGFFDKGFGHCANTKWRTWMSSRMTWAL
jgi:hypothetical protein